MICIINIERELFAGAALAEKFPKDEMLDLDSRSAIQAFAHAPEESR